MKEIAYFQILLFFLCNQAKGNNFKLSLDLWKESINANKFLIIFHPSYDIFSSGLRVVLVLIMIYLPIWTWNETIWSCSFNFFDLKISKYYAFDISFSKSNTRLHEDFPAILILTKTLMTKTSVTSLQTGESMRMRHSRSFLGHSWMWLRT